MCRPKRACTNHNAVTQIMSKTFEQICTFEVLYQAYKDARKGKRNKRQEAEYERNVLENTLLLSEYLLNGKYKPGAFETFYVYEPKKRLVQAPAFVDKVVQHALVDNYVYGAITRDFIYDNAASQRDKGIHFALDGLKRDLIDYHSKHKNSEGWVLKCDVRHFFASINHDILKIKLKSRIEDKRILNLLYLYIDASREGLPLGYQTSQLFALLFLNKFDHFVKETLKIKYYGRYMDDFYLICESKEYLKTCRTRIEDYMSHLGLELNEKTQIFPLKNGLDFLGFHTYITESGKVIRKLRRNSVKRLKANIKYWRVAVPKGKITKTKVQECFRAWDAHAAHGDTLSLRIKYAEQVSDILNEPIYICAPIKTSGKKQKRIKIGKTENERLAEWYLQNIILNDDENEQEVTHNG